jgi:tetratricopeptide (TPR) repeat protein
LFASGLIAGPLFFVLSNLPIQNTTTGPILEPYLVLVSLCWAVFVAWGLSLASSVVNAAGPRLTTRRGDVLAAVVLAAALFHIHTSFRSHRGHFHAYYLGRNILRTLPPRAVLYDPDDPIAFTLRGLQILEHRRNDVLLLNFFRTFWGYKQLVQRHPDLLPPAPVQNAQDLDRLFWTEAIQRRPFYADLPAKVTPPRAYQVQGIVYPIQTTAAAVPSAPALQQAERWFDFYAWRGSWRMPDHPDFFTRQILNYRSAAYSNLGIKHAERRDWERARRWQLRALSLDPAMHVAYNNLGVTYYEERRFDQARENFRLALRYNPGNPGYARNLETVDGRPGD